MISDWPEVRLEDVTSILGDGLHGTPKYDEDGDYYFINGNNLGNGKIIFDEKTKRASKEEYLKHKKNLNDRTILVSINGTIGNVGLYNGEKVFLGKSACYFNVLEDVDKQFIRYVVTSSHFQNYIHSLATGSTIKNVSLKLMRNYTFRLPPLDVQKQISKVLEDLDNKIELNHQINQTLEQIAQAIFKSWFVDFEPVKAKIEAKQNGQDPECAAMRTISGKTDEQLDLLSPDQRQQLAATAAQFPCEFEGSGLGEIPKGWEVSTLGKYTDFQNGYAFKSKDWQVGGLPVVKIGSVKPGLVDLSGCSFVSEDTVVGLEQFRLYPGDLLVGMTGYPGETGLIPISHNSPYLNQRVGRVRPIAKNPEFYTWIYANLRNSNFKAYAKSRAHGSAQANVSGKALMEYPVCFPGKGLVAQYHEKLHPMISLYLKNSDQSSTLTSIRDSMLPKLLSGEINIGISAEA